MMSRDEMAREIRSLASGTVATLCGSCNYDDIDEYVEQWCQWVMAQGHMTSWPDWFECHQDFACYLSAVTLTAGFHIG